MKVNMTPNPLDVVTIHASQGDTEARQWEFELHNNGELIDTSDVTEQMFFKAYEDGTEQLLPENTSTPTTSPFLGDIRYPQGLLTDQEFLYRQSPTEEDGNAKITDIKGNTLVWNQLVQNGNFADTSKWIKGGGASSLAISNNEAVITIGGAWNNDVRQNQGASFISGHKYFASFEAKATAQISVALSTINATPYITFAALTDLQTTFKKIASIVTAQTNANDIRVVLVENGNSYIGETFTVRNVQIIDLTAMGLDITDPSEFTSLFPLSYYSYNQGSLLSFNGNGIKTTGKNLLPLPIAETKNGITLTHNDDGSITLKGTATALTYFDFSTNFDSSKYAGCLFTCQKASQAVVSGVLCRISQSNRVAIQDLYIGNNETEVQDNGEGLYFAIRVADGTVMPSDGYTLYPMLRMSSQDSTFEPYTSSTTDLPTLTYFPTGMKSAGNVYDELTPSKAITRIGSVDLGSLTWVYYSAQNRFAVVLNNGKPSGTGFGLDGVCDKYAVSKVRYAGLPDQSLSVGTNFFSTTTCAIVVHDENYTDATTFKQAMADQNAKLYYELATPTETSFTTASLVTENGEIPLSNEDGTLIGKCTEQLSENPGFIDAKIKLSDGDGECYSNKIQLHVERSPQ